MKELCRALIDISIKAYIIPLKLFSHPRIFMLLIQNILNNRYKLYGYPSIHTEARRKSYLFTCFHFFGNHFTLNDSSSLTHSLIVIPTIPTIWFVVSFTSFNNEIFYWNNPPTPTWLLSKCDYHKLACLENIVLDIISYFYTIIWSNF